MEIFFNDLKLKLEKELHVNEKNSNSQLKKALDNKLLALKYYSCLKEKTQHHVFSDDQDEIHYFKFILPQLESICFYYSKILELENEFEISPVKEHKKIIKRNLKRISDFKYRHQALLLDYETGNTESDCTFFLRRNLAINKIPAVALLHLDKNQTTTGSYIISKKHFYDLLERYLKMKLNTLEASKSNSALVHHNKLKWTASKTALVELMYGLLHQGVINHGKIDVKELTAKLESIFDITIEDPYRIFTDIKQRKKELTLFLNELKKKVEEIIDNNSF